MEALSHRRAEVIDMGPVPGHAGRTRMSLACPSRLVTMSTASPFLMAKLVAGSCC